MAMPFRKILCPVYFDETSPIAVEYARFFAQQDAGTVYLFHAVPTDELHLLRKVYHPREGGGGADVGWAEQVSREKMEALAKEQLADVSYEIVTRQNSDPAKAILDEEKAIGADLAVMATHGRTGISHLILGSVAEKVVRESKCPVLSTRRAEALADKKPFQRLLVPVDIAEQTSAALTLARSLVERSGGMVYPLHVVPTDETELLLHDVYEARESPTSHKVNAVVAEKVARQKLADLAANQLQGQHYKPLIHVSGDPGKVILELEKDLNADAIIMTTHGVSGFLHLLLGSLTEKMMREAGCPVLAFRP
ncbi:MAG: universal stress protein [Candidatus Binatia bacterium]